MADRERLISRRRLVRRGQVQRASLPHDADAHLGVGRDGPLAGQRAALEIEPVARHPLAASRAARRRAKAATPIRPVPKSQSVAGSGTTCAVMNPRISPPPKLVV